MSKLNHYSPSPLDKRYLTYPLWIPQYKSPQQQSHSNHKINHKNNQKNIKKQTQSQKLFQFNKQIQSQVYQDGLKYITQHPTQLYPQTEQGIFIQHQGPAILYHTHNNLFYSNNYFFYPSGITIKANFNQQGKLQHWLTVYAQNKFVDFRYYKNGNQQRTHYHYSFLDKSLYTSTYERGRLIRLQQSAFSDSIFQSRFKAFQQQMQQIHFTSLPLSIQSKKIVINKNCVYYGQSINQIPQGIGIIIGKNQRYYGTFKNGILQYLGTIMFENQTSYYGEINQGVVFGYGILSQGNYIQFKKEKNNISSQICLEQLSKKANKIKTTNKTWLNKNQIETLNSIEQQFLSRYFNYVQVVEDVKDNKTISQQKNYYSSRMKASLIDSGQEFFKSNHLQNNLRKTSISKKNIKLFGVDRNSQNQYSQRQPQKRQSQEKLKVPRTPNDRLLKDYQQCQSQKLQFFKLNKKTDSIVVQDKIKTNSDVKQIIDDGNLVLNERGFIQPEHINNNKFHKRKNKIFQQRRQRNQVNPMNYIDNQSDLKESIQNIMISKINN